MTYNITPITQSSGSDRLIAPRAEFHTCSNPSPPGTCSSTEVAVTWGHHHTQIGTSDGVHTGQVHSQARPQARPPPHTPKSSQLHTEGSHIQPLHKHTQRPSESHPLPQSHHSSHPQVLSQDQSLRHRAHARLLPPTQSCHVHPKSYLIGNGKHQTMPGNQVVGVTQAGPIPGHVDGEARACSLTYLAAGTLVPHRKEGAMIIAVQRNVQHAAGTRWEGGMCLVSEAPMRHGPPTSLTTPHPLPQPLTWGPPQICAEFHYHDGRPSPRSGS